MRLLRPRWWETLVMAGGLVAGYGAPPPGEHFGDRGQVAAGAQAGERARPAQPAPLAPPAPPPAGRAAAESPELQALRAAEQEMFPAGRSSGSPAGSADVEDNACDKATGCASEEWLEHLRMPDLPVRIDANVRRYVHFFAESKRGRKIFEAWLARSGRYRSAITQALRDRQLPQDLHAVVFVESGYSPSVVSPAGAVGLWQLMPSTARAYGLTVASDYDERRGLARASEVGARHLSDLYERFGSWDLALAAYNMGYQAMVSRMQELGTEDFWEMSAIEGALPRESALYVPKVLAVALILRNLDRFGFEDRRGEQAVPTVDLEVPSGASMATLARAAGTSVHQLRTLNPEILRETVPGHGQAIVHIPASGLARARVMLPKLLDPLDRDGLEQKVGPSFDWGKDELPRARGARTFFDDAPDGDGRHETAGRVPDGRVVLYRVGDDDTLESVAKALGTTVDDVVKSNKLDRKARLKKGALLVVHPSPNLAPTALGARAEGAANADRPRADAQKASP